VFTLNAIFTNNKSHSMLLLKNTLMIRLGGSIPVCYDQLPSR
jgi:hypothetical protein